MVLPRPAAFRALWKPQVARASRTTARAQWHQVGRRGYASQATETVKKAGGDLPWLVGSLVVTVPTVAFLLQPSSDKSHDHGHAAPAQAPEPEPEPAPEPKEEEKPAEEPATEEPQAEESGSDESESQDTPDTSDSESEDVKFKGPSSKATDTRESIPDAKGGNKKRINSDYAKDQGPDSAREGEPGTSETPKKPNETTGKQAGLSNTDTRHSTDIGNDPNKSKKEPGVPETAKTQGTVQK